MDIYYNINVLHDVQFYGYLVLFIGVEYVSIC